MKKALLLFWTLLMLPAMSLAQEWTQPVIPEPYDYAYQDENRSIVIDKITEDNSTCFVADVQISDVSSFHTAQFGDGQISDQAAQNGAVLAINADNYAVHDYGVIIRDGQLLRAHDTTRHMLALLPDGSLRTVSDRKANTPKQLSRQLMQDGALATFEFGPVPVINGQAASFPKTFDVISTRESRREPHTAIGMIAPLHYLVIVVDGRQSGYSEDMSLQALQQMFVRYGAQTAINLDGGGSTEMWFQGQVISSPSGGKERYVSDMIWW